MNVNGVSAQQIRSSNRLSSHATSSPDKEGSDSTDGYANQSGGTSTSFIALLPTTTDAIAAQRTTTEYLAAQSSPTHVMREASSLGLGNIIRSPELDGISDFFEPEIVGLQDKVNSLEIRLHFAIGIERIKIWVQLLSARAELRQESLKIIEDELQNLNDTSRPDSDSPYSSFATTTLSRADLELLAKGPKDDPLTIAARNLLSDSDSFSGIAGADGTISLGDIQTARIAAENDVENAAEQAHGADGVYEVPDGTDFTIGAEAHQPEIGQEAFDAQQDAIEQAIRTGEEVSFVNGAGETVMVTVTPLENGGSASYSVQVREYSIRDSGHRQVDTSSFTLNSEIGTEETITALANIIDWGSSLDTVGAKVPDFPGTIDLRQEWDSTAAASYDGPIDTMTFFNGTANINKSTYIHELGHAIGWALGETGSVFPYSPVDWEDVISSASGSVSEYAPNPQEEFSEALAAYINAADHGPEALAEFREAFPDRAAYIENYILKVDSSQPVTFPVMPIGSAWSSAQGASL